MTKQLNVKEANAAAEKIVEQGNKTADDMKVLSASAIKAREDAEIAEPGVDSLEAGVKNALAVARAAAEAGRYSATISMHDANYQTAFRVLEVLKREHGFSGRQYLQNNTHFVEICWS